MALLEWVMPVQFAHINKKLKNTCLNNTFSLDINTFWCVINTHL